MVTPDARRSAVAHACDQHGVSQRRACQALTVDRSSVRYQSIRPDDGAVRAAMKKVAAERRRFGYRRIHHAAAAGLCPEPEEAAAAVPGGEGRCAAAAGATGFGFPATNGSARQSE